MQLCACLEIQEKKSLAFFLKVQAKKINSSVFDSARHITELSQQCQALPLWIVLQEEAIFSHQED